LRKVPRTLAITRKLARSVEAHRLPGFSKRRGMALDGKMVESTKARLDCSCSVGHGTAPPSRARTWLAPIHTVSNLTYGTVLQESERIFFPTSMTTEFRFQGHHHPTDEGEQVILRATQDSPGNTEIRTQKGPDAPIFSCILSGIGPCDSRLPQQGPGGMDQELACLPVG
jgi:hypothetical protein